MISTSWTGLEGRTALVTGGGRGIGRAVALELARAGATVAVNYRRDRAAAQETTELIRSAGGTARAYRASVDAARDVERMVERINVELGPVTILVNNGGTATRPARAGEIDPKEMLAAFRVHTLGPLRLCQLVLPFMREQRQGAIVMMSSSATQLYEPFGVAYSVAKAGMEGLAFTLAKEERRHGVRVNVVAPGLVDTEMGQRLVRAATRGWTIDEIDEHSPFGRVCQPADVAHAVAFLVSDQGSYITGERLRVDGGEPKLVQPPRRTDGANTSKDRAQP